jgi:ATP/maltotriose-dependent transcriptional regulator MalT
MPRSAIIWTRSRELSLNVRYHLMHRMMISWSKCRPLKRSCAEVGSVISAVTAGSRAFQVCTRTGLTAREAEVLYWITEGKTNPEIAIILDASPDTVKKHAANLMPNLVYQPGPQQPVF